MVLRAMCIAAVWSTLGPPAEASPPTPSRSRTGHVLSEPAMALGRFSEVRQTLSANLRGDTARVRVSYRFRHDGPPETLAVTFVARGLPALCTAAARPQTLDALGGYTLTIGGRSVRPLAVPDVPPEALWPELAAARAERLSPSAPSTGLSPRQREQRGWPPLVETPCERIPGVRYDVPVRPGWNEMHMDYRAVLPVLDHRFGRRYGPPMLERVFTYRLGPHRSAVEHVEVRLQLPDGVRAEQPTWLRRTGRDGLSGSVADPLPPRVQVVFWRPLPALARAWPFLVVGILALFWVVLPTAVGRRAGRGRAALLVLLGALALLAWMSGLLALSVLDELARGMQHTYGWDTSYWYRPGEAVHHLLGGPLGMVLSGALAFASFRIGAAASRRGRSVPA